MRLRPRYSLLTLLVLTALIAGGVKLWHGPHHLRRIDDSVSYDYYYTRDWRGNRTNQGLGQLWSYSIPTGKLSTAKVSYFEQGSACWPHKVSADSCINYYSECAKAGNYYENSPLAAAELAEYKQALEGFIEDFRRQGCKHVYIEHDGKMTTLDF